MLNDNIPDNIKEKLKEQSGSIAIIMHHKPDGDAMGSALGLHHLLKEEGIETRVISPSDYAHFLSWMPGTDTVLSYQSNKSATENFIDSARIIFCLDFNSLSRVYDLKDRLSASEAELIMIDHHRNPEDFDLFRYWDHDASSTCELIYQFIDTYFDINKLSVKAASCLYTGIMTDTGSFRFSSTTSTTHRVVANLVDRGANGDLIHQQILDNNRLERLQLLGFYLSSRIELMDDLPVAIGNLSEADLKKYNVKTGDTEGFVNYGLGIKGVELAVLIVDRTELVKMSFRSSTDFPCNEFAKEFFKGGGHKNAAGGQSTLSLEETINRFKEKIYSYKGCLG